MNLFPTEYIENGCVCHSYGFVADVILGMFIGMVFYHLFRYKTEREHSASVKPNEKKEG